jgi:SAM-dependent methyltransferase
MDRRNFLAAAAPLALAGTTQQATAQTASGTVLCTPARTADVVYEPTPLAVVQTMMDMGSVKANDVVYDLGCGDGRIAIGAAKRGATGVGIDLNYNLIEWANANAKAERVQEKVKFLHQDIFTVDLSEASVITLYLLPQLNLKLRPKLWKELKVGTRIVGNAFDMGDWKPDRTVEVPTRYLMAYLWTIKPEHKQG